MGIIKNSILLWVLLLFSAGVFGQETPDVHKINGKKYYLHVVEPGNTLYGISRLFEVTIDQIEVANPVALRDGLKVNQTLLIPVTSDNKKQLEPVEQKGEFLEYVVQPQETLYSIAQRYNVKMDAILQNNPEVATNGLKAGNMLKIPIAAAEVDKSEKTVAAADSLKGHVVQEGETLFSIKTKYGVEMNELVDANPGVNTNIRVGSVLRIPGTSIPNKPKAVKDTTSIDSMVKIRVPDSAGVFRVGLLLPLNPTFPDSGGAADFKINSVSRIALNYYRGVQFAIDSLDSLYPVQLKVKVYSVENDTYSLNAAFNDPGFDSLDLLIGPFYTSQFEAVADRMLKKGVPVICPINKPSKILFKRPNTIKLLPSESMQISSLAEFLALESQDSNLILVNSNKFQDTQNIDFFKDRYATTLGIPDTFADDVINEIKFWDVKRENVRMRFRDSGDYVLVVPSKNQVFVTKLLNELYNYTVDTEGSHRFKVYGISEWVKWDEALDMRHLQRLSITLPFTGYIDLEDSITNSFFENYYRQHGFEPTHYTLQGFDLTSYLYEQLSTHPVTWFKNPHTQNHEGVYSNIIFKKVLDDSGIENQYVRFYQYSDFKLNKVGEWPLIENK